MNKEFHHALAVKHKKTKPRNPSTSIFKTQEKLNKENAEKMKEEDLTNKPLSPFTYEQLMKYWVDFSELLKAKGKAGMHATLNKYKPKLNESDFTIIFDVDSELQKIEFNQQGQDFMSYLRKSLDNYSIKLNINVLALDESVKLHLGSKDKFLKMVDKNPDLDVLRDQFNLDIEY